MNVIIKHTRKHIQLHVLYIRYNGGKGHELLADVRLAWQPLLISACQQMEVSRWIVAL